MTHHEPRFYCPTCCKWIPRVLVRQCAHVVFVLDGVVGAAPDGAVTVAREVWHAVIGEEDIGEPDPA